VEKKYIDDKKILCFRYLEIPKLLQDVNPELHFAVMNKQSIIFQSILDSSDAKNSKNNYGLTPLHIACDLGYFEIAEMLTQIPRLNVKDKWKGDSKTRDGLTVYHLACSQGKTAVVDIIVDNSKNFNIDLEA